MRSRFCLFLFLASVCFAECVEVGPPKSGMLEITAYSTNGERLLDSQITLIDISTHRELTSDFKNGASKKLHYGTYLVQVQAPGFHKAERQVILDQPSTQVRMVSSVSVECGGFSRVNGTVHLGQPHSAELWVKLVPIQGVVGAETRVDANGGFEIGGLTDNNYLLLLLDGKRVVKSATRLVGGGETVNIDVVN